MNGYMGKLLFVNLSTGKCHIETLDEQTARDFLGGPGLGAKILYDKMPPHAQVFGEESMLGFVSGPMNNTKALFGGRYTIVSKSPVTGGWNDANSGGYFGERLKRSGYDAVFVNGISKSPVYLQINDGEVQIKEASDLWGMTVREAEEVLQERHGKKCGIAMIGPAGEQLSYMAAVMNDGHRAAARGGSGAVMGSKKLKAVVVMGKQKTPVADKGAVRSTNMKLTLCEGKAFITDKYQREFFFYGTGGTYVDSIKTCDAGFKNWTATNLVYPEEAARRLSSQGLKKYKTKKFVCSSCHIGCSVFMKMDTKWGKLETTRPEYETMGAFGSLMLNTDEKSVCMANDLCNQYGFDTISAGSAIAWAMECYERGILTKEELDGIELTWGNGDAIVELLLKMGKQEGIGAVLAKGSQKAAEILGKGFECLAVANGIEVPQHDPRYLYGLGRTYLSDPTPGRHVKGAVCAVTTDPDFNIETSLCETGEADLAAVENTELMNASGACAFGYDNAGLGDIILENLNAVTGFHYSQEEFSSLGQRIFTMRQAFNLREGIKRSDWQMSKRLTAPSFDTALEDKVLDFEKMTDNLYDALHWTREGVPVREKLQKLGGLEAVIRDLYGEDEGKEKQKL